MEFLDSIAQFVPKPIIDALHTESLDYVGELRQVTTLFLSLDSYSHQNNNINSSQVGYDAQYNHAVLQ